MNNRMGIAALAAVLGGLVLIAPFGGKAPRAQTAQAPAVPDAAASGSLPFTGVPFFAEWASSPHAHRGAEAFNHWNADGAIPVECAKCHSTPGFQDFVGADGSPAGVVDRPAPVGTVITCVACHNTKTVALTTVVFPSGQVATSQGADAICMTCHQGVESVNSINKATAGRGDDTVEPKLEFINVHYRAPGAMLLGTMAKAGYEYPGKTYAGRFQHQAPYARCAACHEAHTVAVRFGDCGGCHRQVTDKASLRRIRVSAADYDGTANPDEGLAEELDHQRDRLLKAIMEYAKTVSGKPIVYDPESFPYFFVDTNNNGVADKDEMSFANRYKAWTPRLLKAAYNYQFVTKDPGAYAHNPVYALQLVYDSIADLATKVAADPGAAKRP
jgi:Cytochrome c7 and related cytochrome c